MSKKKSSTTAKKSTTATKKPRAKKTKPKGLGDSIEQITKATGIKSAVDWFSDVTGIDCGCDERKEALNRLVPYEVSCMELTDYDNWTAFRNRTNDSITKEDQLLIVHLHAKIFNHKKITPCTCSPARWQEFIDQINKVYDSYEQEDN